MGEASSQPDRLSSQHGRRAGRFALLTPPRGIPLFPPRSQPPAEGGPPAREAESTPPQRAQGPRRRRADADTNVPRTSTTAEEVTAGSAGPSAAPPSPERPLGSGLDRVRRHPAMTEPVPKQYRAGAPAWTAPSTQPGRRPPPPSRADQRPGSPQHRVLVRAEQSVS